MKETLGEMKRSAHLANLAGHVAQSLDHAETLYHAVGKSLLDPSGKQAVLKLADSMAVKSAGMLGGQSTMHAALQTAAGEVENVVAIQVTREAAMAAGQALLKGAAKAAGIGAGIDALFAAKEAIAGKMGGKQAVTHVLFEAGTGGVATAAGVAVSAGIVFLAGPVTAPVALGVAVTSQVAVKLGLKSLFTKK